MYIAKCPDISKCLDKITGTNVRTLSIGRCLYRHFRFNIAGVTYQFLAMPFWSGNDFFRVHISGQSVQSYCHIVSDEVESIPRLAGLDQSCQNSHRLSLSLDNASTTCDISGISAKFSEISINTNTGV